MTGRRLRPASGPTAAILAVLLLAASPSPAADLLDGIGEAVAELLDPSPPVPQGPSCVRLDQCRVNS